LLFDLDGNGLREQQLTPYLLANPEFLFLALDVAIFDADFATVSALKNVEYLSQCSDFGARQPAVMNSRSRSQIVRP